MVTPYLALSARVKSFITALRTLSTVPRLKMRSRMPIWFDADSSAPLFTTTAVRWLAPAQVLKSLIEIAMCRLLSACRQALMMTSESCLPPVDGSSPSSPSGYSSPSLASAMSPAKRSAHAD